MTVLLVILWHVVAIPVLYGVEMPGWFNALFDPTYPMRLPLMVTLAGMFLPMSLTKAWPVFFSGKIRNLAWPYAVWFIITVVVMGDFSAFTSFWALVGGPYHLWFLAVLFSAYMVAPVTRWVPFPVMSAAMLLALHFGNFGTAAVNRFLFWGSFFFLGAFIWGQKERIAAFGRWFPCVTAALGIAAIVYAELTLSSPKDELSLRAFVVCLPWILTFLWIGPRLPRIGVLEQIGRNNIVWYLAHFPAMAATTALLLLVDAPAWIIYAVGIVTSFGVPWVMMRVRPKIAWLFAAPRFRRDPAG